MYRSILVPLDGSNFGEHALPLALSIARRAKAGLHLIHIHTPLHATYAEIQLYDTTLDSHLREREKLYLEGLAKRIGEISSVPVATFNKVGDVAPTLRDHVISSGNDLVVMATHGRGPLGKFWLGSNTDELIRDLPNEPLLLVHPQAHEADLTQDVVLKHFLLALDGSSWGEQVLEPALELGKVMEANYTLLRVVHPITPMDLPVGVGTIGNVAQTMIDQIQDIHGKLEKEAHEYLEKVAQKLRSQGLKVNTQVALDEQAGVGILHRAEASQADLIAMETHGKRGLKRLFMGSTTSKVLRNSTLPILVHRPVH